MRDGGRLPASYDVDEAAAALLAGVRGGEPIMMSTGGSTHLEAAIDVGIRHLRVNGQELALP
jgi:hypothetical protein